MAPNISTWLSHYRKFYYQAVRVIQSLLSNGRFRVLGLVGVRGSWSLEDSAGAERCDEERSPLFSATLQVVGTWKMGR